MEWGDRGDPGPIRRRMAAEFREDGGAANWVTLRRALHRRRRAYELHRIGLWLVALVAFASFGAKSFVRLAFEIPAFQPAPRNCYGVHRGSLLVRLLPCACLWVCDAQRNIRGLTRLSTYTTNTHQPPTWVVTTLHRHHDTQDANTETVMDWLSLCPECYGGRTASPVAGNRVLPKVVRYASFKPHIVRL